ncbi:MAG TPA: nuclear transport factor 2 family protein [Trebonia sp.]|jgi:ketosteroid isomerase-like protein|nr:nuclear transport factor 2 family protein [Trebonia sp.]
MASVDDVISAWAQAELAGDTASLDSLLHPQFLSVGPFGFILDREQWKARFGGGLSYRGFSFEAGPPARAFGGTQIVIGTQKQEGEFQGRPVEGALRVTLVLAQDPDWQIVSMHISLGNPPVPPGGPGAPGAR